MTPTASYLWPVNRAKLMMVFMLGVGFILGLVGCSSRRVYVVDNQGRPVPFSSITYQVYLSIDRSEIRTTRADTYGVATIPVAPDASLIAPDPVSGNILAQADGYWQGHRDPSGVGKAGAIKLIMYPKRDFPNPLSLPPWHIVRKYYEAHPDKWKTPLP